MVERSSTLGCQHPTSRCRRQRGAFRCVPGDPGCGQRREWRVPFSASMSRSACSSPKISGGRIFKVARSCPVRPISTPLLPHALDDPRRCARGRDDRWPGSTMSTATASPQPRTSPTCGSSACDTTQRREESGARGRDAGHHVLLLERPEHGDRCRARRGAAAERAEVVGVRDEGVHQLRGAADGGDRVAVAHRLAQRHQVSRHLACHEAPQVRRRCARARPAPRPRRTVRPPRAPRLRPRRSTREPAHGCRRW